MEIYKLEQITNRVLSGKQVLIVDNTLYELRSPSIDLKIESDLLYNKEYENLLYSEDFIHQSNIDELLIELGLIYPEYKMDLESIDKRIENSKIDLYLNFFDRTKRQKYRKELESHRKRYNQIYQWSHSLDPLTLEHFLSNMKHEFIIRNTLYKYKTNLLVFDTEHIDYAFFNRITQTITENMLDMSILKKIARSDYWRNYYSINKNHLLSYSTIDFSDEQKALLSLSNMYDKIYEHPECPENDILEDDDALDGWMLHQQKENKRLKKEKGVNTLLGNKNQQANEVFLMASNKDQSQDIIGLNTKDSEMIRKNKVQEVISSNKIINDSSLSDVQHTIRNKIQELNKKG